MERQARAERRKTPRKIKRLSISYSDGQKERSGISSDFSLEGLFIRTRNALPPGTPLKMVLEVGRNQKINLAGFVVWSVKTGIMDFKNGMGIKITYKPIEYMEFILNLLN